MGSGIRLINAPFLSKKGVQQGAVESSWFCAIVVDNLFKKLNQHIAPHGSGAMAIINNNYAMGPQAIIFPANKVFAADLGKIGLQL